MPQTSALRKKRQRVIIIGSRNGENVDFPQPIHGAPGSLPVLSESLKPWASLREALDGMLEEEQEYTKLPVWGKYLEYVKPGGCWRDIPLHLQQEAMKGAYSPKGVEQVFSRRLGWDGPSPTLVTFPVFKGSCSPHPDRTGH